MSWFNSCNESKAGKRYQRRVLTTMAIYMVLLFGTVVLVKHVHVQGALLYVLSVLPAVPVIVTLGWMAVYLKEETDEYLRMITMRALLVGTAALLGVIVVSDFLQSIAERPALPPFTCFVVFFLAFGIAQGVQKQLNRGGGDE
jgi:hypothetical protein